MTFPKLPQLILKQKLPLHDNKAVKDAEGPNFLPLLAGCDVRARCVLPRPLYYL
jgi:hypothetical protein